MGPGVYSCRAVYWALQASLTGEDNLLALGRSPDGSLGNSATIVAAGFPGSNRGGFLHWSSPASSFEVSGISLLVHGECRAR